MSSPCPSSVSRKKHPFHDAPEDNEAALRDWTELQRSSWTLEDSSGGGQQLTGVLISLWYGDVKNEPYQSNLLQLFRDIIYDLLQ